MIREKKKKQNDTHTGGYEKIIKNKNDTHTAG